MSGREPTHPARRLPDDPMEPSRRAGEADRPAGREALAELCRAYWYPIYAFIRRKGHAPDAALDLDPVVLRPPDRTRGHRRRRPRQGAVPLVPPGRLRPLPRRPARPRPRPQARRRARPRSRSTPGTPRDATSSSRPTTNPRPPLRPGLGPRPDRPGVRPPAAEHRGRPAPASSTASKGSWPGGPTGRRSRASPTSWALTAAAVESAARGSAGGSPRPSAARSPRPSTTRPPSGSRTRSAPVRGAGPMKLRRLERFRDGFRRRSLINKGGTRPMIRSEPSR